MLAWGKLLCDQLSKTQLFSHIPQIPFITSLLSIVTKERTAKVSAFYDKLPWSYIALDSLNYDQFNL